MLEMAHKDDNIGKTQGVKSFFILDEMSINGIPHFSIAGEIKCWKNLQNYPGTLRMDHWKNCGAVWGDLVFIQFSNKFY